MFSRPVYRIGNCGRLALGSQVLHGYGCTVCPKSDESIEFKSDDKVVIMVTNSCGNRDFAPVAPSEKAV